MKTLALAVGIALIALAAVIFVRALGSTSRQVAVAAATPLEIDAGRAADGLAEAIRFRTVSHQEGAQFDGTEFTGLHALFERRFPRLHQALTREVVDDYSLLYTWPGRREGKPIVLLAHLDVVPVEAGTEGNWSQPPFSGAVADGYVWGRGALDDKGSAMAILEAVEYLVAAGVEPAQTVYLAFGHDEEISGDRGAAAISARLRERGVAAELVLDEGGWVVEDMVPGITAPVASVCVGEKGYVSVELSATAPGGHSSMPPRHTAVGVLSAAIARLEDRQMPVNLTPALGDSFAFLGPELPLWQRLVFANLWLFGPLVERELVESPQANAAIRTTTAATIFNAGVKENILPAAARAVVNFRILPGDTVEGVVEHVRRAVGDPSVGVRVLEGSSDPSPLSDPDVPAFTRVAGAIRASFPGTLVTPFLSLGATDARYYTGISPNVYRFIPAHMRPEDLARMHGTNERVAVADYVGMIRFYIELLRSGPGTSERTGHGAVTRDFMHGGRDQ